MEYQIVTVSSEDAPFEELEEKVNYYISRGWKPLGGISVIQPFADSCFFTISQAMIKE